MVSPKLDRSDGDETELATEVHSLRRRSAEHGPSEESLRRDARPPNPVEVRYRVTLEEDTSGRIAFSVSDESERWQVRVEVEDGTWPRARLSGNIDLTATWKAQGTPGCLARVVGGAGRASAVIDAASLQRRERLVEVKGQANRFGGRFHVAIEHSSPTKWVAACVATLQARGLGRPVLWFAGRRLNATIIRSLKDFWSAAEVAATDLEGQMRRLRAGVAREGGERLFVRRLLWGRSFKLDL